MTEEDIEDAIDAQIQNNQEYIVRTLTEDVLMNVQFKNSQGITYWKTGYVESGTEIIDLGDGVERLRPCGNPNEEPWQTVLDLSEDAFYTPLEMEELISFAGEDATVVSLENDELMLVKFTNEGLEYWRAGIVEQGTELVDLGDGQWLVVPCGNPYEPIQ